MHRVRYRVHPLRSSECVQALHTLAAVTGHAEHISGEGSVASNRMRKQKKNSQDPPPLANQASNPGCMALGQLFRYFPNLFARKQKKRKQCELDAWSEGQEKGEVHGHSHADAVARLDLEVLGQCVVVHQRLIHVHACSESQPSETRERKEETKSPRASSKLELALLTTVIDRTREPQSDVCLLDL